VIFSTPPYVRFSTPPPCCPLHTPPVSKTAPLYIYSEWVSSKSKKRPVRENLKGEVWRGDSAEEKPALNHSSLTGAFKGRNRISLNLGARAEAKRVSVNARVCEKTAVFS